VYRTVVFKTVAGQSRCPHEQGTAPREKFRLEFADGLTQLTVFSKGASEVAFPLYIKNESPRGVSAGNGAAVLVAPLVGCNAICGQRSMLTLWNRCNAGGPWGIRLYRAAFQQLRRRL